jgi:hypothetical protein
MVRSTRVTSNGKDMRGTLNQPIAHIQIPEAILSRSIYTRQICERLMKSPSSVVRPFGNEQFQTCRFSPTGLLSARPSVGINFRCCRFILPASGVKNGATGGILKTNEFTCKTIVFCHHATNPLRRTRSQRTSGAASSLPTRAQSRGPPGYPSCCAPRCSSGSPVPGSAW